MSAHRISVIRNSREALSSIPKGCSLILLCIQFSIPFSLHSFFHCQHLSFMVSRFKVAKGPINISNSFFYNL